MKRNNVIDMLVIKTIFLLLLMAVVTFGQQIADPNFDAKVTRPAYTKKHPKVLFDEAHFNFHTAAGRYKPFADFITNDGYQVTPNKEKFEKKKLEGYEILIIANAQDSAGTDNPAFSEQECDAVSNWVKSGGSLLLIADHQPWGAAAANLAKRFAVEMKSAFTIDPSNYDQELGKLFGDAGQGILIFRRDTGLVADHPITRGRDEKERINRVTTFVGQSLKGAAGSISFLKLAPTALDVQRSGERLSAGGRSQGIALSFGRGRVVVLGEAAMLSAQVVGREKTQIGMNRAGIDNRQLALNIMHWLSGLLK